MEKVTYSHQLIVGSSYSYFALITNKVITAISSIFIARLLGPENLGIISINNYLLLLLLFFTGLGIPTANVKLISEYQVQESNKISEFIVSTFIFNLLIIIIISLLYFVSASFIAMRIYHEARLIPLFQIGALALFFFSLNQFGNSIIQAFGEFKKLSLITVSNSIFGLLILIPFTKIWHIKGVVISQVLAGLVTFMLVVLILKSVKKKNNLKVSLSNVLQFDTAKVYILKLLRFTLPVFLSGLVMNPVLMILTTLLTRFSGFREVGYFNVSNTLTQIILFIPAAVGVPFIPLASKLAIENPDYLARFTLKTIYGAGMIVLALSFMISIFSYPILSILYGHQFLLAQNILILMSTATFLAGFGYIIGYYLLAVGKVWLATLLNVIWFVAILAPAYHLIKHFGANGLGISYLISYIVLSIIFVFYLKLNLKLDIKRLVLHLCTGIVFPLSLFVIKQYANQFIVYLGLFVLFTILFIIEFPKMVDISVVNELFRDKLSRMGLRR